MARAITAPGTSSDAGTSPAVAGPGTALVPRGFLLAGTHSGCGKTTLAAGLLRAFRRRGEAIAPFKAGPDYLDPMLHAVAAGRPSWNLDGWLLDDAGLREAWSRGGAQAGLALAEGVMGLFDGADPITFQGSGADLARRLGLPTVLVLDGSSVGGSIAATVLGHERLWPGLEVAGVILNRLGGPRHFDLQRRAIEAHTGVRVLGWMPMAQGWSLPERHLGIRQPREIEGLEAALDVLAAQTEANLDLDALAALARAPRIPAAPPPHPLGNLPVALARDEAFSFIYADTLDRLERLGVRWIPFSPLRERLPEGVAGLYLPGGYPELHAQVLSRSPFLGGLRAAHAAGLPIFAECGGYMIFSEALVDLEGRAHRMAGLVPGRTRMTGQLQSFGYKQVKALKETIFCARGTEGRAHEFHHSTWEDPPPDPAWATTSLGGEAGVDGIAQGALLAGYLHFHLGTNPAWATAWVGRMERFRMMQA